MTLVKKKPVAYTLERSVASSAKRKNTDKIRETNRYH